MENEQDSGNRAPAEPGAMIGFAVVVTFAVLIAAVAGAGKSAPEVPADWATFRDVHGGVPYTFHHPPEIVFDRRTSGLFDDGSGKALRPLLWYEVRRNGTGTRIGTLEVLVPPPDPPPPDAGGIYVKLEEGTAAFRFRPLVRGDGETLLLFRRILDRIH
jgi:hypothetical protein